MHSGLFSPDLRRIKYYDKKLPGSLKIDVNVGIMLPLLFLLIGGPIDSNWEE